MRVFLAVLTIGFLLLAASPGWARDIYVDNLQGDDSAKGIQPRTTLSDDGPVRTLAKALRLADGSDRIVLIPTGQPYRESVGLVGNHHSGSKNRPFTIYGAGAVLDGTAPVPDKAWERVGNGVFRFRPRRLGHQQLFRDGRPVPSVPVKPDAKEPPQLEPSQWCLWKGHILFRAGQDKLPPDYELSYAREEVGITLTHVRNVLIVDLTVQGFRLDGIQAANDARDVTLLRVTSRGNGRSGLTVGGACRVDVQDSLLGNNTEAQLITQPFSDTRVSGTELLAKPGPAWLHQGGQLEIDGKEVGKNEKP
ncbi:MAG: hypothetical protein JW818_11060 [Pirellulales bacterium]|nr:hypothetical protein [Pirellulales bacterium]